MNSGIKVFLGQIENADAEYDVAHLSQIIREFKSFNFKRFFAYKKVKLIIERPDGMKISAKMGLICWMLSGRNIVTTDYMGVSYQRINLRWMAINFFRSLKPRLPDFIFVKRIRSDLKRIQNIYKACIQK